MAIDTRLDGLRQSVACEVIAPSDSAYDEARTTFNGTIDRRPAAVIRPRSPGEVGHAVRWARDAGLPIAIRGGGHSVAGHAVADGAVVIDLLRLRDVAVDPERRRAMVGGGALWEDVDRATVAHDLATPGGTFGDTGVGGLTLGGGIGFLMGTAGLTCDNLVRAEVVTADGSIVVAGEDGDSELLWALRGGGGNFGVVTSFEFALHPLGALYGGYLSVPIGAAADALGVLATMAADTPRELVLFAGGPSTIDDAPDSPVVINLTVVYQGTADEAERSIQPLRSLPVLQDGLAPRSYIEIQEMSGRLPFGLRNYWKGQFIRDLDGTAIDASVAAMADGPGSSSFLLLEAITGVAREEPPGGAAFGQRAARWNASAIGIWEDPADDAVQIAWVRDYVDALRPVSLTGAGYGNYAPVDETAERVRASFGNERFERLQRVKRRYDPDNVFRFNHNIPPSPPD
ncbi:MAG TPA: FAD-binding oxidoreductase [Candidatus Limnocylindrales bacterium]|nr:FAD-binding oxidoreductase [Candidatus Limnocylindrales bacterium]